MELCLSAIPRIASGTVYFRLSPTYKYRPGRQLIEALGYKSYRKDVTLDSAQIPNLVHLEPNSELTQIVEIPVPIRDPTQLSAQILASPDGYITNPIHDTNFFEWRENPRPANSKGESGIHLVVWKECQDPITDGLVLLSTNASSESHIIEGLFEEDKTGSELETGEYLWGIVLTLTGDVTPQSSSKLSSLYYKRMWFSGDARHVYFEIPDRPIK